MKRAPQSNPTSEANIETEFSDPSPKFPTHYPPLWHIGARMGVGPVTAFLERKRSEGAQTFLDVGCGPGSSCLLASKLGYKVFAADLAPASLNLARDTAREMDLRLTAFVANGLALPFPDKAFDVVFASHIIEHLDDPAALLTELDRVLKPGGALRLACPSPHHGMRLLPKIGLELDPHDHKVLGYDKADIAGFLPPTLRIVRATYQGRFFESNGCDLQYLIARRMHVQANPVDDPRNTGTQRMPTGPLFFLLRECALLPWIAAAKLEDTLLPFTKGSMISIEIEKDPLPKP